MGVHALADLAWGVNFGNPTWDAEAFDFSRHGLDPLKMQKEFEDMFEDIFGAAGQQDGSPVEFRSYREEGDHTILVLKRSLVDGDYGCTVIDPAKIAAPTQAETEMFRRIWQRWRIDWPMTLQLLLVLDLYS